MEVLTKGSLFAKIVNRYYSKQMGAILNIILPGRAYSCSRRNTKFEISNNVEWTISLHLSLNAFWFGIWINIVTVHMCCCVQLLVSSACPIALWPGIIDTRIFNMQIKTTVSLWCIVSRISMSNITWRAGDAIIPHRFLVSIYETCGAER